MRIGIDTRGLDLAKTGISTYIEETLKRINITDNDSNEYILYSNKEINLDIQLRGNIKKAVYNKPMGAFWLYYCLPKILKNDKIDVFWGPQHCLPKKNKYTKKIKYIVTIHDVAIYKLKKIGRLRTIIIQILFLKKSCKSADTIMTDSESTKKDISELFKINPEKIEVVYLGTNLLNEYTIGLNQEKEILKKFEVEDKNYLLFVSTIEPRKNIITLVKAFEKLKDNGYDEMKLILAGGLGWRYQEILNTINYSKYKSCINLAGYISNSEKQCLLKNCKCFTYPSLYEGFGLPILEAMANDAIVVTSNISSLPEVGGKAAIYYDDVKNYEELANKIEYGLKLDKTEKSKLIELGHRQVNRFTWEKCTKQIYMLLNKFNINLKS